MSPVPAHSSALSQYVSRTFPFQLTLADACERLGRYIDSEISVRWTSQWVTMQVCSAWLSSLSVLLISVNTTANTESKGLDNMQAAEAPVLTSCGSF